MNLIQRIGNGISRFMYGRNGPDHLGVAVVWLAILVDLANILVKAPAVHTAISAVSSLAVFWAIFRLFSRNLYARRRENAWFLEKVWQPLRRGAGNARQQAQDKEHKYFTCPACRTMCRVPRGKGRIIITCPKCGGEIRGKS